MPERPGIQPILFPVDEEMEARMRKDARYVEWTCPKNLKTKLVMDKDCTRVVFAEREMPGVMWDVDPNHQSVLPFLEELRDMIEILIKNVR